MKTKQQFLADLEIYLNDLPSETKINMLSQVLNDIEQNPTILSENTLDYANKLRSRFHFTNFKKKKEFSVLGLIAKLFVAFWLVAIIAIGALAWKFSPIFKVDEETQRVIVLGGLIDIDGKSGKVKIFDQVQISDNNQFTDSFQMNMNMNSEVDELDLNFKTGKFTLKNSTNNEIKFDCKLSGPFDQKMIEQDSELIKVNFASLEGATCEISVPEGKRILLEGVTSQLNIEEPLFNIYIEIETAHVAITPAPEHDYLYNLELEQGYVGDFKSADTNSATEIQVRLQTGTIVTK
ncbi:MAG: hypothetical protein VYA54_06895 [Bdellovibrionota bacterium]|nr:hypothetical protein [Bdellovibrionota bacterium]